jgi:topoisomerase-4 subunit A
MTTVTIRWFEMLKDKYGPAFPRRTEIRSFENIVAAKVIEANQKLYINREEGFIGTSLKKDEFVTNCSDIDDVILFYKDGRYKIVKVAEKMFVGTGVLWVGLFKKNDKRTIYNVVYRDGKNGPLYIKRFAATGLLRDKEYDLTQGKPGSRVVYFTANPNGEAEIIKVSFKPNPRLKRQFMDKDFSEIAIKGRGSMGNLLTRLEVTKVGLKSHGGSTLGGRKVWFDRDILRLDFDGHGDYLGEFQNDDRILVVLDNGDYYTTDFDQNNHYDQNVLIIEKYDSAKVWTALLFDATQKGYLYLKRFMFDSSNRKCSLLGEGKESRLVCLSEQVYPRFLVTFGEPDAHRAPLEIDGEQFVDVKSVKARGRRVSQFSIASVEELEPLRFPEPEETEVPEPAEISPTDASSESVTPLSDGSAPSSDEGTEASVSEDGQFTLF